MTAPPPDAFFLSLDADRFEPTEHTRGPWEEGLQHGGPPCALLARAVERAAAAAGGPPMEVARLTFEFLRPVPIAPLAVQTQVLRAGKRIRQIGASLSADGTEVLRVASLLMRTTEVALPELPPEAAVPPGPETTEPFVFPFFASEVGYHRAVDLRIARGEFSRGPVAAWIRMRHPLVAGEAPTPLQRVAVAADSGNGVSFVCDPKDYLFINPDLTIHLCRMPAGEWVCLDARTTLRPHGIGMADTALFDEQGPIGRSVQSLFVDVREEGR